MACLRGCIITLVALVWLFSLVSLFLQDFLIPKTEVIILTSLFHGVVFCPNGSFKLIGVKNHNLTFSRHTFTFDEYKDKDTRSPKKNVLIFNLRTISIHMEVILSNSSDNSLFPLHCSAVEPKSSLSWLILLTLVEFRLGTSWTINFLQNYNLYIDDGFIHGGNVTVSYSHPSSLWHIPTRWEYDWWEYAGRPWCRSIVMPIGMMV